MKLFFSRLLTFAVTFLFFFTVGLIAFGQTPEVPSTTQTVFAWLLKNWEYVALVVSELVAFLPAPYSGIVKTVITVIGKILGIFQTKSSKIKK
jgi:hypothetical protein